MQTFGWRKTPSLDKVQQWSIQSTAQCQDKTDNTGNDQEEICKWSQIIALIAINYLQVFLMCYDF